MGRTRSHRVLSAGLRGWDLVLGHWGATKGCEQRRSALGTKTSLGPHRGQTGETDWIPRVQAGDDKAELGMVEEEMR